MVIKKGDLVACYLTNTEVHEELLEWGIVLDTNPDLNDILVLSNNGASSWWPAKRWKLLEKKTEINLTSGLK